jgi:hypothetical protein
MRTKLTEKRILKDLKTLSHGGIQAVTLFMNMCKKLHEKGAEHGLREWITIAAPSLPEAERNEILVMVMCSHLLLDAQTQTPRNSRVPSKILH